MKRMMSALLMLLIVSAVQGQDPKQRVEQALQNLGSQDAGERKKAVETLTKLKATKHAKEIAGRLKDEKPEVRLAAARALEALSAFEFRNQIIQILEDEPDAGVREAAKEISRRMREAAKTIAKNEKSAMGTMREMINISAQWKMGDRDRNGVNDYWVADVSGMFRIELPPAGSTRPAAYINIALARADGNPFHPKGGTYFGENEKWQVNLLPLSILFDGGEAKLSPKNGYLYEAMVQDEKGNPYIQDPNIAGAKLKATNVNKFGFVAYPLEYGVTGTHTFIVWENGVVFKADLGEQVIPPYKFKHPGLPIPVNWSTID